MDAEAISTIGAWKFAGDFLVYSFSLNGYALFL
jgi:hypothetical protein